jgi:hypothetical protein
MDNREWLVHSSNRRINAEAKVPAEEGPGVTAAQQAAVERNMKAVAFLTLAMPDLLVINVLAAGLSNADWPNQPKAHLMVAYPKDLFEVTMTISRVGVSVHNLCCPFRL